MVAVAGEATRVGAARPARQVKGCGGRGDGLAEGDGHVAVAGTSTAPLTGLVLVTLGALSSGGGPSQGARVVVVVRAAGVAASKSPRCCPCPGIRGPCGSQQARPRSWERGRIPPRSSRRSSPCRSPRGRRCGRGLPRRSGAEPPLHPSVASFITRATLPAVRQTCRSASGRCESAVGSGAPTAACEDSCTRKYWPGCSVTSGSSVSWVAEEPKLPRAGRRGVLEREVVDRHVGRPPVEDLDVVVGVGRTRVATAAVDLADHQVGGDGLGGGCGDEACGEHGEHGQNGDRRAAHASRQQHEDPPWETGWPGVPRGPGRTLTRGATFRKRSGKL